MLKHLLNSLKYKDLAQFLCTFISKISSQSFTYFFFHLQQFSFILLTHIHFENHTMIYYQSGLRVDKFTFRTILHLPHFFTYAIKNTMTKLINLVTCLCLSVSTQPYNVLHTFIIQPINIPVH